MDSRRQLKIGSLIKEVFSQVLLREGKNLYGKALVTVTNVKVTSDLTLACLLYTSVNDFGDKTNIVWR